MKHQRSFLGRYMDVANPTHKNNMISGCNLLLDFSGKNGTSVLDARQIVKIVEWFCDRSVGPPCEMQRQCFTALLKN